MYVTDQRPLICLFGPTGSGKTALALALGAELPLTVVNADAMQLYRELPLLTAQPTAEERAAVAHELFGVRAAAQTCSVGQWLDLVRPLLAGLWAAGRVPLVVGGTGLYHHSLLHGLAPLPAVPEDVREAVRDVLRCGGLAALNTELARLDPLMHARLEPGDTQRRLRALEVVRATGRSIDAWQALAPVPVLPADTRVLGVALDPERALLRHRIAERLRRMVAHGLIEEVRAYLACDPDPSWPLSRAHGVPEFRRYFAGAWDLAHTLARTATVTGQYAKRQATWRRHRLPQFTRIAACGDAPATQDDVRHVLAPLLGARD